MKLIDIHIASFGKLNDFDLRLEPGMNVLIADNEYGKSTIFAFIRAALYGFEKRTSATVKREFGRMKYMPWQRKTCGGSIRFEHECEVYLLECTFGMKSAEDAFVLALESTGERIDIGEKTVGEYLFDMTEQEFLHTAFVGQLGSADFDGKSTDSVTTRLLNLAAGGEERYSFADTQNRIKTLIASLASEKRADAVLPKLSRSKEMLTGELLAAENHEREVNEVVTRTNELDASIRKYDIELHEITKQNDTLQNEIKSLTEKKAECDKAMAVTKANLEKTSEQRNTILLRQKERAEHLLMLERNYQKRVGERKSKEEALEQKKAEIKKTNARAEQEELALKNSLQQVDEKIARGKQAMKTKTQELEAFENRLKGQPTITSTDAIRFEKTMTPMILIVLGCMVTLAFVCLGIMVQSFLFAGALLGVILLIVGFVVQSKQNAREMAFLNRKAEEEMKKEAMRERVSNEEKEIAKMKDAVREAEYQYNFVMQEKEHIHTQQQALWTRIRENHEKESSDIEVLQNALTRAINEEKAAEDDWKKASLEETKDNAAFADSSVAADMGNSLTEKESHINAPKTSEEIAALEKKWKQEIEAHGEMIKHYEEQIKAKEAQSELLREAVQKTNNAYQMEKEEQIRLQTWLSNQQNAYRSTADIDEDIKSTEEKMIDASAYLDAAKLCEDALGVANKEMESHFAPRVNQLTGEYMHAFTEGKYSSVRIRKSFGVDIATDGEYTYKEGEYLSGGTLDQVYLALRLSISDLLQKDERSIPLLLDDAFIQYDDERTKAALHVILKQAKSRQVLLFSCHRETEKLLDQVRKEEVGAS